MIHIKSAKEIEKLRRAGELTAGALKAAGEALRPGMTTSELNKVVERFIVSHGAKPGFKGYGGFPAAACISVNDEVIHGIPGPRKIMEGDIVSVDTGAWVDGYYGDACRTFACGQIAPEVQALLDSTSESLELAVSMVKPGVRVGDLGEAIQKYNEERGFSVVREFVGHGLGRDMHEEPEIPNFGRAGKGIKLQAGMVICIEPMINMGSAAIKIMPDGWTVKTQDGKWSAHFEHAIAITQTGAVILDRL
ncbi:MAG: type I methionyl aminopeptidase [Ruminococcus sp.]|nr:type I methionyl aminopeptidase [Ruminococcus sp.]